MRRLVLVAGMLQHTSAKHRGAFSGSRAKSKNWPICKSEGEHVRNLKGCSFRYMWTQRSRDVLKLVRADRVSKYCAAWLYLTGGHEPSGKHPKWCLAQGYFVSNFCWFSGLGYKPLSALVQPLRGLPNVSPLSWMIIHLDSDIRFSVGVSRLWVHFGVGLIQQLISLQILVFNHSSSYTSESIV